MVCCFEDLALFDRGLPIPVSREHVAESWKPAFQFSDPPKSFWFVTETGDGEKIGICGVQSINYVHGDAVVPLFVSEHYRGIGHGTAMLCELIDLAFNQLRLHRLSTVYRANNTASQQLVSLVGFAQEGRVRGAGTQTGNIMTLSMWDF